MPQNEDWTLRSLLQWTTSFFKNKGLETPKLEAEILLAYVMKMTRVDLYLHYDDKPTEELRREFGELVRRRGSGEPTAYIVGKKEFYSLDFEIKNFVLIPRPETEQLVLEVVEDVKKTRAIELEARLQEARESGTSEEELANVRANFKPSLMRFCDLGSGSGCISVAIVKNVSNALVAALDVDEDALILTKDNARRNGVSPSVCCMRSNVFSKFTHPPLEEKRFNYIVSNPPYVSEAEYETLDKTVKDFEPRLALVGGETGAEIALKIVKDAPDFLKLGGKIYLELSPTTVEIVADAMRNDDRWTDVVIKKDYAKLDRFLVAVRCK